jgi:hypothetical protein
MLEEPWLDPKLDPEIVIDVPTCPLFVLRLEIDGGVVTVNVMLLLWDVPSLTTTGPEVAAAGTETMMES